MVSHDHISRHILPDELPTRLLVFSFSKQPPPPLSPDLVSNFPLQNYFGLSTFGVVSVSLFRPGEIVIRPGEIVIRPGEIVEPDFFFGVSYIRFRTE